jgi:mannose-6-phosphate isomerase-like protein (cupin superfamily)
MTNARVFRLREPGEIDPRAVLTGPLTAIRRTRLAAAEAEELSATGKEFTFFVLAGQGVAATDTARVDLAPGVSVTVPLHTELRITAGSEGLEYFLVELAVAR